MGFDMEEYRKRIKEKTPELDKRVKEIGDKIFAFLRQRGLSFKHRYLSETMGKRIDWYKSTEIQVADPDFWPITFKGWKNWFFDKFFGRHRAATVATFFPMGYFSIYERLDESAVDGWKIRVHGKKFHDYFEKLAKEIENSFGIKVGVVLTTTHPMREVFGYEDRGNDGWNHEPYGDEIRTKGYWDGGGNLKGIIHELTAC